MSRIRLFVSDVDREHVQRISHCVERQRGIEFIGACADGNEALRRVALDRPDVLITDLQLPGIDGIRLLRDLQNLCHPPTVIVCTHFYSDLCVAEASRYAARYFLYKPLDYSRLPEVIAACARRPAASAGLREGDSADRSRAIRALLREMGIPARLTGSAYLTESLIALRGNDALLRNLSKGLYLAVAEQMESSAASVERCMRTAISYGFSRGGMRHAFSSCPSNKAFIEYLAGRLDEAEPETEDARDYVF